MREFRIFIDKDSTRDSLLSRLYSALRNNDVPEINFRYFPTSDAQKFTADDFYGLYTELLLMENTTSLNISSWSWIEVPYEKKIKAVSQVNKEIASILKEESLLHDVVRGFLGMPAPAKETAINLSGFDVDDELLEKLAHAIIGLPDEYPLITLNFVDCSLTIRSLNLLAEVLQSNQSVEHIDLSYNLIKSSTIRDFDNFFERTQDRKVCVYIAGNYLSDDVCTVLIDNYPFHKLYDTRHQLPSFNLEKTKLNYRNLNISSRIVKHSAITQNQGIVFLVRDSCSGDPNHVFIVLQRLTGHNQVSLTKYHLTKECGDILANSRDFIFSKMEGLVDKRVLDPIRFLKNLDRYKYRAWELGAQEISTIASQLDDEVGTAIIGRNCLVWAEEKLSAIGVTVEWESLFAILPSQKLTGQVCETSQPSNCTIM